MRLCSERESVAEICSSTAKLRIWTLRIWGFRGPGFRSARQVLWGDASRLFLDHFPKHRSSVLGWTELCHEIISNENHHLALFDMCPSPETNQGTKQPTNINNFSGLSLEWEGVKLLMCCLFLGEEGNTQGSVNGGFQTGGSSFVGERNSATPFYLNLTPFYLNFTSF